MNIFWKILYTIFFIMLIIMLIKFVLLVLLIILVLLWLRTWQMKKEPQARMFAAGSLPNPKMDGLYKGTTGFESPWIGKKINAEVSSGINLFRDKKARHSSAPGSSNYIEKYPFKTYTGKGLFDPDTFVLKIDYNVKGNPFWIKYIVDEVVQTKPDEYLGKMNIKIIPGLPFSVLYFELKK